MDINHDAVSLEFQLGHQHALERGPKTHEEIQQIQALSAEQYVEYLRGVKAGMEQIVANSASLRR